MMNKGTPAALVKEPNKKTIVNQSLQSFPVCLLDLKGNKMVTLRPKQSLQVNESEISQMVLNLARRKIVKII